MKEARYNRVHNKQFRVYSVKKRQNESMMIEISIVNWEWRSRDIDKKGNNKFLV